MKTIWKLNLEIDDYQIITVPEGAEFLTVQMQAGFPCIWFRCDPDQPPTERLIAMHGTGHNCDDQEIYIGTFQQQEGLLVWHVFEIVE